MKRVTGIGGIFFKCRDAEALREWYRDHLGIVSDDYGAMFKWRHYDDPDTVGFTVWGPFRDDTDYFGSSEKPYMINYRVDDLDSILETLRAEGVEVADEIEDLDVGRFSWIVDPEGTRIELWEPTKGKVPTDK